MVQLSFRIKKSYLWRIRSTCYWTMQWSCWEGVRGYTCKVSGFRCRV